MEGARGKTTLEGGVVRVVGGGGRTVCLMQT